MSETEALPINPAAAEPGPAAELLPALARLDVLIAHAIERAPAVLGPGAAASQFRGLYIDQNDVAQLLACSPGAARFAPPPDESPAAEGRLGWLAQTFGLEPFDLDLIVIALAPELDLRYERIFAYLQDDVACRRPSVDLALNLLCAAPAEKIARRANLAAAAPLLRHELIRLSAPYPDAPLLAHTLILDAQIVDVLLGQGGLDRRLAGFCRLETPAVALDMIALPTDERRGLVALALQATLTQGPLRLLFAGPQGSGRHAAGAALAAHTGARLLSADLGCAPHDLAGFAEVARLLVREAWLQGALLYLDELDAVEGAPQRRALLRQLNAFGGIAVLAGADLSPEPGLTPLGAVRFSFDTPGPAERRAAWRRSPAGEALSDDEAAALAERYPLGLGQIADAAAAGFAHASLRLAAAADTLPFDDTPTALDLRTAARARTGGELARVTRRIVPSYGWDDLVLPADAIAQLHEICGRAAARERVLDGWGFAGKLARGRGVNALFAGPSGTGKTMAAEVIAGALGLDLYAIDLAGVVSKYIGETEKNLARIFRAAESAGAVLLFDEADALFGKRSEVKDSHDRYANIEVSYLLQQIEQYPGVSILASNLRHHMDEALTRRLAFVVHFPFPEEPERQRIWQTLWPAATPLDPDVDLGFLARQFKLSGGNIKNIAVAAAYLAATNGGIVTMSHLRHATRREYQKLGKAMSPAELGEPTEVLV